MSLSPYARDLVRKAGADAPPSERRELARKRFIEASAAAATGAAATATAATAGKSGAATIASAKLLLVAKIAGVVAIAIGGAAVVVGTRSDEPSAPRPPAITHAPTATTAPTATILRVPEPSEGVTEPPPHVAAAPRPIAPVPKVVASEAKTAPSASAEEPADPLVQEAQLLEKARACLAAADVACARERLREHDQLPHPRLTAEAAFMNIEVLRAEGRANEARKAATTFIDERPTSPYVKRVRALLKQLEQDDR